MITTDYIVIGILLLLFFQGWRKGFLRTLIGPLSLVIACLTAYIYYLKTKNVLLALVICIIGPFIINIFISIILKIWNKTVNDGDKPYLASKILGGSFNTLWGGSYLAIVLFTVGIVPIRYQWFVQFQKKITLSKSYSLLNHWTNNKLSGSSTDINKINNIFQDPEKLKQFETTKEFQSLMEDEKLKEILLDEETAKQIQDKNYGQLLSNPKIQEVFQDEVLLKKLFALNKRIMEGDLNIETFQETDIMRKK